MKKISQPKVRILRRMGRPMKLPGLWAELANAVGGVDSLAKAIGLSVRQTRRLAHKESPLVGPARVSVLALAAKYGKADAFEVWERGPVEP